MLTIRIGDVMRLFIFAEDDKCVVCPIESLLKDKQDQVCVVGGAVPLYHPFSYQSRVNPLISIVPTTYRVTERT